MSNNFNWQNLNKTIEIINSNIGQLDIFNSVKEVSNVLEVIGNNLGELNNAKNWQTMFDVMETQIEMCKSLKNIDFVKLFGTQTELQNILSRFDFPAIATSMQLVNHMEELSEITGTYDISNFSRAIESAFKHLNWANKVKVTDIVEEVTEQYVEQNKLDEKIGKEIKEVIVEKRGKHLTELQRKIWEVYIYPFLLTFFFFLLSLRQNQPMSETNITEINNYYTIEVGIDAIFLNDCNFRVIIEDNVMPRIKPNRSSSVVDHLPVGKIVHIVKKYRKWILIVWKNSVDDYCSGWIQSYKVRKFI